MSTGQLMRGGEIDGEVRPGSESHRERRVVCVCMSLELLAVASESG